MIELDETDRTILRALVQDATQSAGALGRKLGLSQPATWRRIRRLEEAGVIARRVALLSPEQLGLEVTVFASVKLSAHGRQALPDFEADVLFSPRLRCFFDPVLSPRLWR